MIKVNRDLFVSSMELIQEQTKIDDKNSEAFKVILPNDYVSSTENVLYDGMIKLLMHLTDDSSEWINYFIYELNFGGENGRLKVTSKEGKEIPLATVEDLWNLLNMGD